MAGVRPLAGIDACNVHENSLGQLAALKSTFGALGCLGDGFLGMIVLEFHIDGDVYFASKFHATFLASGVNSLDWGCRVVYAIELETVKYFVSKNKDSGR